MTPPSTGKSTHQRLAALQELDHQIDEVKALLADLQGKRQAMTEAAQHEEIERLEQHFSDSRVRLKDLAHLAEQAWLEIKTAVDELLRD